MPAPQSPRGEREEIRVRRLWDGHPDHPVRGPTAITLEAFQIRKVEPLDSEVGCLDVLLTPAFINAHCHLELTHCPPPPPPRSGSDENFVAWLLHVMRHGPATGEAAAAAAVDGARQSLRFGVTTVVDITRNPVEVRPAVDDLNLLHSRGPNLASCTEITGLGPRRANGHRLLDADLRADFESPKSPHTLGDHATGLAPHAPYSTSAKFYQHCADDRRALPHRHLTTHLAETPAERRFLADRSGPFRDLWNSFGPWNEADWTEEELFPEGPIFWLEALGVLDGTRLIAVHVNDATDDELRLLAERGVTVVHCPRTHAYFKRPRFDLKRYLDLGVHVRLGTDSAASAGDLDLLADLRLFASLNPDLSPFRLFAMATPTPYADTSPPLGAGNFLLWPPPAYTLKDILTRPEVRPSQIYLRGELVPPA